MCRLDKRSLQPAARTDDEEDMRRGQILLLTLVVLLLAVPVAGADDSHQNLNQAVGVTADHATLQSWVLPLVAGSTSAVFEYGTTTDYGATVAAAPTVLPKKGAMETAVVSGLQPATTYHFRVVLSAGLIHVAGPDATFTTAPAPESKDSTDKPDKSGKGGDDKSKDKSGDAPEPVEAPKAPVLGRSLAVGPRQGSVRVLKPHGRKFEPLAAGSNVPTGSVVDASEGTVALTSALDRHGKTQTGEFTGGRFLVRQSKGGMVDIYLRGSLGSCRARTASIARKRSRALWGRDHHGRFRTHGATSVATVRGTHWLTEDTCAGTVTKVTSGVVSVRDQVRHRTVTVRAGHSYLARRKHRR
jgi:hypothetical protein